MLAGMVAAAVIIAVALPFVLFRPAHAASLGCGIASYYSTESGRVTANGERFPTSEATAAHRTLPFNTHVRVTDTQTGRSVVVRINDRGPAAWTRRIIDLSPAARRALGMGGLAKVCLSAP